MTIVRTNQRWTALFAAALLVLLSGQTASADDAQVRKLEDRVAELEALVRTLAEEKGLPTKAAVPAPAAKAEATHSFKIGGYVKVDAMFSDYSAGDLAPGSAGTQFYIPGTIPVGAGSGEGPDADFQARETRINFKSDHALASGDKLTTFLEMDFFLSPGGNERVSGSYNPRIRHAFIKYNNWLFGQTWSTFQDVGALAENLDFVGPAEGTTFVRQAMIRYTNGPWEFALENPETTITPFGGGSRIVTDDGAIPDIAGRYTMKTPNGYIKFAGLLRQLDYDVGTASDSETAFGLSVSGKHSFGQDDIRWMGTIGSGTGRYLGLNTANGAVLNANGDLDAIDQFGGFVSFRHFWDPQWRSNFTASYLSNDHDTTLTGTGVTKNVYSLNANLLYEPVPKLLIGGELMYAKREVESGADGDLTRLQFSAKYGF